MVQALRQPGVGVSVPRLEPPPPPPSPPVAAATLETPPITPTTRRSPTPTVAPVASVEKKVAPRPKPPPRQEITGDGILFPAMVIGLGGLGLKVLKELRNDLEKSCAPATALPHLQLLHIDTDPATAQQAFAGPVEGTLTDNEILLARLNKPSHYLRPTKSLVTINSWLNMNMLCKLPRNQTTTDGLRLLGRLALADNYRNIVAKVKNDLSACTSPGALTTADRQTRLGMRSNRPRVYVVTGLSGGTGSGMFIDLGYVVRRQLEQLGFVDPQVIGIFLLPAVDRNARKNTAIVNAFAALTELEHFSSPKVAYTSSFDESEEAFAEKVAPFSRCVMMSLPEEGPDLEPTKDTIARVADLIHRELVTPLGRSSDKARAAMAVESESGMTCQTFGSYVLSNPRRLLLQRAGRALVHHLLQGWLTSDRSLAKAVRTRLSDQLTQHELTPEALITSLQTSCINCLQADPEAMFPAIVSECIKPGDIPEPDAVQRALDRLEEILGQPQEEGANTTVHSPMVDALDEAAQALQTEWENKLVNVARAMLDDIQFRVVGAEEAVLQITTMLQEAVEQQQAALNELQTAAEQAYLAIDELLNGLQKGSWWPGRKTRLTEELRQALEQYPKARYEILVLEAVFDLHQALAQKLPKRLEEIGYCRRRLSDWQDSLDETKQPDRQAADLGPGRHFLPYNSPTVEEAVETLLGRLGSEDLEALDEQVQDAIHRQFKSLTEVCQGSPENFKEFTTLVFQLAERHFEAHLGTESVAEVLFHQHADDTGVHAELNGGYEAAAPVLPGRRYSGAEMRLLFVPTDEAGKRLGELSSSACPDTEVVFVDNAADIFFYRERPHVSLAELPQLGLMAEEIYRQMTASGQFTPHTRTDIKEWQTGT
jgi:hypothetical protein